MLNDATRFESDNHLQISRTDIVIGDLVKVQYLLSGEEKIAQRSSLKMTKASSKSKVRLLR